MCAVRVCYSESCFRRKFIKWAGLQDRAGQVSSGFFEVFEASLRFGGGDARDTTVAASDIGSDPEATLRRKHVRGFFADLVRRPSQSIGAGTRAVRAAAVCVAEERSASSPDVDALRAQLEELRMGEVIQQALNPDENSDDDPRKAQRARENARNSYERGGPEGRRGAGSATVAPGARGAPAGPGAAARGG